MLYQKNSCLVYQHLFNRSMERKIQLHFVSSGMVTGLRTDFLGGKEEWLGIY